jgi:hypothetical protein
LKSYFCNSFTITVGAAEKEKKKLKEQFWFFFCLMGWRCPEYLIIFLESVENTV